MHRYSQSNKFNSNRCIYGEITKLVLITVRNGKVYLRVIGTIEEDYEIYAPIIKMYKFGERNNQTQNMNPIISANSNLNILNTNSC